jgi:Fuc2NAc and GlcNAc transferase
VSTDATLDPATTAVLVGVPVVAFAATAVVRRVALRRGHLDIPNQRSSHAQPTPRGGGVAIVVAIVAGLLASLAAEPLTVASPAIVIPGVLLACVIGLRDDANPLRPSAKMLGLVAAAACVLPIAQVETPQAVPFAGDVGLAWAAWPLTALWLACYPNAFNFMDGLDGIAALTTIVSCAVFAIAGVRGGDAPGAITVTWAAAATGLAAAGFLPWNFPRARIFMGDAGSLPLGLLLATCAVLANAADVLPFPASILLLGPFMFDVAFTLFRRSREGKTIGEAHKEHLYQRLSRLWGSHAKVSLLYASFSVVTGGLALAYDSMGDAGKLLSLVGPLAAMLGFAALVLRAERRKGV